MGTVSLPRVTAPRRGGARGARRQPCSGHQSFAAHAGPHPDVCVALTGLWRLSPDPPRADSPVLGSSEIMGERGGRMRLPEATGQDT